MLARIRNSLDEPAYQALLNEMLLPIWDEDFLLLQDNAPPHKAVLTMSSLEENGITVVNDWPSHSPDMNVIEDLWNMLSDKWNGKEFTNSNDWSFLEKELHSIPESYIQKLFECIPRRIQAVLKHRGYPTKY